MEIYRQHTFVNDGETEIFWRDFSHESLQLEDICKVLANDEGGVFWTANQNQQKLIEKAISNESFKQSEEPVIQPAYINFGSNDSYFKNNWFILDPWGEKGSPDTNKIHQINSKQKNISTYESGLKNTIIEEAKEEINGKYELEEQLIVFFNPDTVLEYLLFQGYYLI